MKHEFKQIKARPMVWAIPKRETIPWTLHCRVCSGIIVSGTVLITVIRWYDQESGKGVGKFIFVNIPMSTMGSSSMIRAIYWAYIPSRM
jgi:hypothetical protein